MPKTKKFTVAVPAYKPQFLAECIESILGQTFANFELLIVDDASPFDVKGVVAKYEDERIRYYRNDIGFGARDVVGNWNKCLELATGDYIICMGDDDKLMPNCLANYNKAINEHPDINLFHCHTVIIDENSAVTDIQDARPEHESVYAMIFNEHRYLRLQFIGDFLFKTSTLRARGGFYNVPWALFSDNISAHMAAKEGGVVNVSETGFQYRQNRHTISNNTDLVGRLEALKMVRNWYTDFLSEEPKDERDKDYGRLAIASGLPRIEIIASHALADELRKRPWKWLVWLAKGRRYGVTLRMLVKSTLIALSQAGRRADNQS